MSGLSLDTLEIKNASVESLLDEPARKYLKPDTITANILRSYNLVFTQIEITANPPITGNQIIVSDAIRAIAAWFCFGTYGQSISSVLQLQDIAAFEANLKFYKDIALMYGGKIGVSIDTSGKGIEPTLNDTIPVINSGNSLLDTDD